MLTIMFLEFSKLLDFEVRMWYCGIFLSSTGRGWQIRPYSYMGGFVEHTPRLFELRVFPFQLPNFFA